MITHLIFSGAGIKSLAYLSSLQLLESNNFLQLNNIQCFVGSSSGAMVALLLSLNYSIQELLKLFFLINLEQYQSIKLENLIYKMGIDDGNKLLILLNAFLKYKGFQNGITFKELFEKTKKTLIITGTNITLSKCEYFSFQTTPNMPVVIALRISMCYPFYYQPFLWNNCYYIDGAILDDLPIKYLHINCGVNINNIFGLLIHEKILHQNRNNKIIDLESFCLSLIYTIVDHSIHQCCNEYKLNYLQIDIDSVNPVNLSLDLQTKKYIFNRGIQCTQQFLNTFSK